MAGSMFVGMYFVKQVNVRRLALKVELNDSRLAVTPLIQAERDRKILKAVRGNWEEEQDLMKDVTGWEVGTWYGERLYKTIDQDTWFDPLPDEVFQHNSRSAMYNRIYYHHCQ